MTGVPINARPGKCGTVAKRKQKFTQVWDHKDVGGIEAAARPRVHRATRGVGGGNGGAYLREMAFAFSDRTSFSRVLERIGPISKTWF